MQRFLLQDHQSTMIDSTEMSCYYVPCTSESVYISTEHVFALAALLGFRFAPRISDALSKKLYLPGEVGESGPLETLAFGQVNRKLISEQWDEMGRVASSIRHGTVSASPACAQTGCLPAPKSGRAGADGGRQARTNGFLAGVFSR